MVWIHDYVVEIQSKKRGVSWQMYPRAGLWRFGTAPAGDSAQVPGDLLFALEARADDL